jgi:hypothetical protein
MVVSYIVLMYKLGIVEDSLPAQAHLFWIFIKLFCRIICWNQICLYFEWFEIEMVSIGLLKDTYSWKTTL